MGFFDFLRKIRRNRIEQFVHRAVESKEEILIFLVESWLLRQTLERVLKRTITKYQVEQEGLDWDKVFKNLKENNWVEVMDDKEVRLTADLEQEKSRMLEVLGADFKKILSILQLSLKGKALAKDPWEASDMVDYALTFSCPKCGELNSDSLEQILYVGKVGIDEAVSKAVAFRKGPAHRMLAEGRCPECRGWQIKAVFDPAKIQGSESFEKYRLEKILERFRRVGTFGLAVNATDKQIAWGLQKYPRELLNAAKELAWNEKSLWSRCWCGYRLIDVMLQYGSPEEQEVFFHEHWQQVGEFLQEKNSYLDVESLFSIELYNIGNEYGFARLRPTKAVLAELERLLANWESLPLHYDETFMLIDTAERRNELKEWPLKNFQELKNHVI